MNGRTRTILAVALATALAAPIATAQKGNSGIKATGNATSQAARSTPRPSLPTQAAGRATEALRTTPALARGKQPTTTTVRQAGAPADSRTLKQATVTTTTNTTTKAMPPTSQGAAHAAAHSAVVQRATWTRLDTNGDGRISATEADVDTVFDAGFDDMDADNDGFVSDAEFRAHAKAGASHGAAHAAAVTQRATWTRLDTDGDGRISATEADLDAGFDRNFDAIDTDNDGFVSDAEFRAQAKAGTSQGAAHAAGHSAVVQRATWTRLDTNGDGRISATEADADTGFDADFDAMDTDNDGFVSDAEFRAHAKVDVGASRAAAHSTAAVRGVISGLDTDGDGRISATEADADAGFDSGFSAMDADGDGFVTDAEYRAHAKANRTP